MPGTDRHAAPGRTMRGMTGTHPDSAVGRAALDQDALDPDPQSDTRYVEPPSETHGYIPEDLRRQVQQARQAQPSVHGGGVDTGPQPQPQPQPQGLLASTLRTYNAPTPPARRPATSTGVNAGLLGETLSHSQRRDTPTQRTQTSSGRAPEAWRDEVRRMVERAPARSPAPSPPNAPPSSPMAPMASGGQVRTTSGRPSLRLKLDAGAALDESESYRAPKSPLPKVLFWLTVLGLLGAGFAYYASSRGGVQAVIDRVLKRAEPSSVVGDDPDAPPLDSAAAEGAAVEHERGDQDQHEVPPAQATTQTSEAEESPHRDANRDPRAAQASDSTKPTTKPTKPIAKAATDPNTKPDTAASAQALELADPKPPSEEPAARAETHAHDAPAVAENSPRKIIRNSKPETSPETNRATKTTKPARARPVRSQTPVVKVSPIGGPSVTDAPPPPPPEPAGTPYIPEPYDPPAPDEPR